MDSIACQLKSAVLPQFKSNQKKYLFSVIFHVYWLLHVFSLVHIPYNKYNAAFDHFLDLNVS